MRPSRTLVLLLVLVTSNVVAQYPGSRSRPTLRKAVPCGPEHKCQGAARPTLIIQVPDSARVSDTIIAMLRIVNWGGAATQPMSLPVTFNNHVTDEDSAHARRTVAIPAIAPGDTLDVPVWLVTDATSWNAKVPGKGRVRVEFFGAGIESDPIFYRLPAAGQP